MKNRIQTRRLGSSLTALTILVLGLIPLLPLSPCQGAGGRGPNENGDDWVVVTDWSLPTSPLRIGDQNVSLAVTLRNLRASDGNSANGDERLYNLTIEVRAVLDEKGNRLQAAESPVTWDVARDDNGGDGYMLGHIGEPGNYLTLTGLSLDVKGLGARAGRYNVSVAVSYVFQTSWDPVLGPEWSTRQTEEESNIRLEIASNVQVGAPEVLDESLNPMPLYASARFQLIGVPVTPLAGSLSSVIATLVVPQTSPLQLAPSGTTTLTSSANSVSDRTVFFFRVDVSVTPPGVYDAQRANITLRLQYIKDRNWDGGVNGVAAAEEGIPLTFRLEYTPLLNATSTSPSIIYQGIESFNLTVHLSNEGNTDLKLVKVTLDASSFFMGDGMGYDGSGKRVPGVPSCTLSSIPAGSTTTALFPLRVLGSIPPGTHRLTLTYSGYYENEGALGGASTLVPMNDALFKILRGRAPYIELEVRDLQTSLAVVSPPPIVLNPSGESEGISIKLSVRNEESFAIRSAELTLLAGPGTPLVNPLSPLSKTLEPVHVSLLDPGEEVPLVFLASLNKSTPSGLQALTLRLNGTNADTGLPIGTELKIPVRFSVFGPLLSIASGAALPSAVPATGGSVKIPVKLINSGGALLSDITLRLRAGPPTPLISPLDSNSSWLPERRISALQPLSELETTINALIDPSSSPGSYEIEASLSGRYFASGEAFELSRSITIRILPAPPRLSIVNITLNPSEVPPGKPFTLSVTVLNSGGETARGVWVALPALAGPGLLPFKQPPLAPEPLKEGGEFLSAEIPALLAGDIAPGEKATVSFNMRSVKAAPQGASVREPVLLWCMDGEGSEMSELLSISVPIASPPAPAKEQPDWMLITIVVLVLAVVAAAGAAARARRREEPAAAEGKEEKAERPAPQAPPSEAVTQAPPAPAQALPPPPPPPPTPSAPKGAVVPAYPLPPPPPGVPAPATTQPYAPPPPGAPPVPAYPAGRGPIEGYSIPGAEVEPRYTSPPSKPKVYTGAMPPTRLCPACGKEVKLRFVKCPHCGVDLPPVT
ncbi:MAG: hypothetical protein QXH42_01415 [Thermoplasmata archaeon]